jgi:CRP-like cAMP-binding protein
MVLTKLSDTEQEEISPFLEERKLLRGEVLFSPDDVAEGVFFVIKGRLGVQTRTGFEDKQQIVALLDPGSPIGEKGLAERGPRKMTVVAIEDSVLSYLPADCFKQIEKSHPELAIKVLKKLLGIAALRLQANSERLAHVL